MATRHEEIAEELRRAIDREEYTVGSRLPAETDLASRYGVSRGTVRQAVAALTAEGLIGSRQGARRVVLASRRSQSFEELRSFAQWARAMGREATGHVVSSQYRPATPEDSVRLQLATGTPVLHVLRVRGLDGDPVLLERTVYAAWISPPSSPSNRTAPRSPSVCTRTPASSSPTESTSSTRSRPAPRTPNSSTSAAPAPSYASAASRRPARAARSNGPTTATARTPSPSASTTP